LGSSGIDAIFADSMSEQVKIRPAEPADAELIFSLVRELAEYERAPEEVKGDPAMLREALFGTDPQAEALIAEIDDEPVGFALFFTTFSTWECRSGLWLEDLYVRPEHRRSGVGGQLLSRLGAIARERGCARLEWAALDWNAPALDFYAKLGAQQLGEWVTLRLTGEPLRRLSGQPD
jgi:GNAT superfamily N-acetyltransferase